MADTENVEPKSVKFVKQTQQRVYTRVTQASIQSSLRL